MNEATYKSEVARFRQQVGQEQEFQVIDEALTSFISRVRQRVPLSREREETLLAIEHMRQRIERLLK